MATVDTSANPINNRYVLLSHLGQGGMGTVYRAFDRLTGDTVALKRVLVNPDMLQYNSRASNTDLRLSLAHEFQTLASMRHPHIVDVLDYGFDASGQPFFTMELLTQAQSLIEAGRKQSVAVKINLMLQLLYALAYLHRRKLLHRDLKPENVLVTQGKVKVVDFGLAVELHHIQNPVGTVAYMAPEVLRGDIISVESDLYAVGIMAYQLFTGDHPYPITSPLMQLINDILYLKPDVSDIELPFRPIIERLLAKNPADRYASAEALIEAIQTTSNAVPPLETSAIRESYLQAASFIGRDHERQLLAHALEHLLDEGRGSAWLIGGESGIGKSRLMDEIRTLALVKGIIVAHGQGVHRGGLPFQLWRDILPRLLLTVEVSDFEASILKAIVPDIARLVDRPIPDAPELLGTGGIERLIFIIGEIIERQPHPLLILLEDLQWAAESLLPLRYLVGKTKQMPVMLVGNYRDDERPNLPSELQGMRVLKLERLTPSEIAQLSLSMLGVSGTQPAILDFLQKETEGNVFFLVEVVRALAESAGDLHNIATMTLPSRVVTGGVQAVIQRRLAQIPSNYQPLLRLAAVAGRQLDLGVLQTALFSIYRLEQMPIDLAAGNLDLFLATCINAAVLDIRGERWRFAHDKLREALLVEIPDAERRQLHHSIAEAIEQTHPHDLPLYAEELAEHWCRAEQPQHQIPYTLLAANRLLNNNAVYERAQELLEQALPIIEQEGNPSDILRSLQLMGDIHQKRGNYDQAHAFYNRYHQAAQQTGNLTEESKALTGLAAVYWRQGLNKEAEGYAEQSYHLAQQSSDLQTLAQSLNSLVNVAYRLGDYQRTIDYGRQALNYYQQLGDQRGVGDILNSIGGIFALQGRYADARKCHLQSLQIKREIGDRRGVSSSLVNLGYVEFDLGNYDVALGYFTQSHNIRQAIGEPWAISHTLYTLGMVARRQGQFSLALQYHEESLGIRRELGNRRGIAESLNELGALAYDQGHYQEAHQHWEEALSFGTAVDDGLTKTVTQMGLIRTYLVFGQTQSAQTLLGESLNHALNANSELLLLQVLTTSALFFHHCNQAYIAALIVGTALHNPITNRENLDELEALLSYLETTEADTLQHGHTTSIHDLAREIYARLVTC